MLCSLIIFIHPLLLTSGESDRTSLRSITGHEHSSDTIVVKLDLVFIRGPSVGQNVALQVTVTIRDL